MKHPSALAVFARAPILGRAKTRLIPLLGREGASRLQAALLDDTLRKVRGFRRLVTCYLYYCGGKPAARARHSLRYRRQYGRGLGERLENAFRKLCKRHEGVIVIGADSPLLPRAQLRLALKELRSVDAVLGPCPDGGYYLIALRRVTPGLLKGVRWGSRFAFADTLRGLVRAGFSCSVLESCGDIDRPADFARLCRALRRHRRARRLAPAVWRFCQAWSAEASRERKRSTRRPPLPRPRRKPPLGRG